MPKKDNSSDHDSERLNAFILSIWKPVTIGVLVGIPIAYMFYSKVVGKRCSTSHHIPQELIDKKAFIRGKVTSVGDSDNFRIYHTPGYGWGILRKVPTLRKGK